jgi:hypothetical protein
MKSLKFGFLQIKGTKHQELTFKKGVRILFFQIKYGVLSY